MIGGLDSGVEGNTVGGAYARNCGNGGEYGVVRIHISFWYCSFHLIAFS